VTIPEESREDSSLGANDLEDTPPPPAQAGRDDAEEPAVDEETAVDEATEPRAAAVVDSDDQSEELLPPENTERFRERWESMQAGFVDKPRETVEEADDLVRDLVQELTSGFVQRRENLERQWNEGDEASTEDLRVALTHYRAFFNRLLST
jgi:molecular chaperone GrpE (heat shock protein)